MLLKGSLKNIDWANVLNKSSVNTTAPITGGGSLDSDISVGFGYDEDFFQLSDNKLSLKLSDLVINLEDSFLRVDGSNANENIDIGNYNLITEGQLQCGSLTISEVIDGILTVSAGEISSIADNSSNWDTAYGWGNHYGLYDTINTASNLLGTHESTYNHSLISTALQPGDESLIDHNQLLNYSIDRHFLQSEISITEDQISNLKSYIESSEKGSNNGVAELDAGGKIPADQLPNTVMEFKGTWNANTNSPTLADGSGNAGDVYLVSVAGSPDLGSGSITFAQGDWIIYNGTIWEKSINSNAVVSVNGQQGVVVLGTDEVNEGSSNLYYTDSRARASISETITGIDYNSSTGVLSLTSGYVIPTTTEESNWNTTYGWGDHAGLYLKLDQTTPQTISNGIPLLDVLLTDFNDPMQFVNKEYVDQAISFIDDFYLNNTASDIGGIYYDMQESPTGEASSTFVSGTLTTGNDQALVNFATLSGKPGVNNLKAGLYNLHIHASVDSIVGAKDAQIYYEIYTRTTGGTETLRGTSIISEVLDDTDVMDYNLTSIIADDVTINITDRIVIKLYANITGSGADVVVTLYAEDDYGTRFTIPTTTEVLSSIFVRQDGTTELTGNWDAGSYKITAETFESDVATGTAPFTVASTTLVSNLNADLWDGNQFSSYLDQSVKTTASPTFATINIGESGVPANQVALTATDDGSLYLGIDTRTKIAGNLTITDDDGLIVKHIDNEYVSTFWDSVNGAMAIEYTSAVIGAPLFISGGSAGIQFGKNGSYFGAIIADYEFNGSVATNSFIKAADGNSSNPAFSFINEVNSGFYLFDTNKMGFSVNAQPALFLSGANGYGQLGIFTDPTTHGIFYALGANNMNSGYDIIKAGRATGAVAGAGTYFEMDYNGKITLTPYLTGSEVALTVNEYADIYGRTRMGQLGSNNYTQIGATGNLTFVGTAQYLVGINQCAFAYSGNTDACLKFSSAGSGSYVFSDLGGTSIFSINASGGAITGDVSVYNDLDVGGRIIGRQGLFHAYKNAVSSDFTTTPLAVTWDVQGQYDTGYFTHTAGNSSITLDLAGEYEITYNIPTDVSGATANRSCVVAWATLAGSVVINSGSTAYNRLDGNGEDTVTKTFVLSATAGQALIIYVKRYTGGDTLKTQYDATYGITPTISIKYLGNV